MTFNLRISASAALLAASLFASSTSIAAPLKIMAVGDSITEGYTPDGSGTPSYRKEFTEQLQLDNCNFEMVGSRSTTHTDNQEPSVYGGKHEGYSSRTADNIRIGANGNPGINTMMDLNSPDVVLIHLGSNDMRIAPNNGYSPDSAVADILAIIDRILNTNTNPNANPNAVIFVANVIPWYSNTAINNRIIELRSKLTNAINNLNNPQVILTDVYSGYEQSMMQTDGVHPKANGEAHIADAFLNAFSTANTCDGNFIPATSISVPTVGETVDTITNYQGTATNGGNLGISDVNIAVRRTSDGSWWNFESDGFGPIVDSNGVEVGITTATLTNTSLTSTNWNIGVTLPVGSYEFFALAVDSFGNSAYSGSGVWPISAVYNVAALNDSTNPTLSFNTPTAAGSTTSSPVNFSGTSNDNVAIDRNKLLIRNNSNGRYWNGAAWTTNWAWFVPTGINAWSYSLILPAGNFSSTAWTWDTSNNIGNIKTIQFTVGAPDTTSPTLSYNPLGSPTAGSITIGGNSSDNIAIDRNKLLVRNTSNGKYWNGSAWTTNWAWFEPTGLNTWAYSLTLTEGNFTSTAWTWDTSNNLDIETVQFSVSAPDTTAPVVAFASLGSPTPGSVTLSGTSNDNVAIDRNKLLIHNALTGEYWNGSAWVTNWAWFEPTGLNNWSHSLTLPEGNFTSTAWTWDTSNNLDIETTQFSISTPDTTPPTVNIVGPTASSSVSTGDVFIYISSNDNVGIDRNKLLVRNQQTGDFWNGQQWVSNWSWFTPGSGTLTNAYSALLIVDEGLYKVIAWTWDTSNNVSQHDQEIIDVQF